MTNPPVELIVAAFAGEQDAEDALRKISTSAIAAVIEHTWVTDLQRVIAVEGGNLPSARLSGCRFESRTR